jgi:hypothetical protein
MHSKTLDDCTPFPKSAQPVSRAGQSKAAKILRKSIGARDIFGFLTRCGEKLASFPCKNVKKAVSARLIDLSAPWCSSCPVHPYARSYTATPPLT